MTHQTQSQDQAQNRILGYILGEDLSDDELDMVAGGLIIVCGGCGSKNTSRDYGGYPGCECD